MLREITIKNFKSICEEQTFSMEAYAKRVNEHSDHITTLNGVTLLRIASIYGPNGGGKSNLLEAIFLVKRMLSSRYLTMEMPNFVCLFSGKKDIEESIYFVTSEYEIGYHFSVSYKLSSGDEGDDRKDKNRFKELKFLFHHESLEFRRNGEKEFSKLFCRDKTGSIESPYFLEIADVIKGLSLSENKSFLSYIRENYGNEKSKQKGIVEFDVIFSFFDEINRIQYSNRNDELFPLYNDDESGFAKKHKEGTINFFKNVGIDVDDITFEKVKRFDADAEKVVFHHTTEKGKSFPLSLRKESSGTRRLFYLYADLVTAIEKESILIIDDFDAKLHPILLKYAIRAFIDSSKKKNAQLIVNSHDIINMTPDLFRRDEIWFALKDNLSSRYVSLSSIINYRGDPVRNDAVFYKQYLEGKYGNDPFIDKGLNFYGNEK